MDAGTESENSIAETESVTTDMVNALVAHAEAAAEYAVAKRLDTPAEIQGAQARKEAAERNMKRIASTVDR